MLWTWILSVCSLKYSDKDMKNQHWGDWQDHKPEWRLLCSISYHLNFSLHTLIECRGIPFWASLRYMVRVILVAPFSLLTLIWNNCVPESSMTQAEQSISQECKKVLHSGLTQGHIFFCLILLPGDQRTNYSTVCRKLGVLAHVSRDMSEMFITTK